MRAFISYGLGDAPFAAELRERIEASGVKVFDPGRDIPPGGHIEDHLRRELEASDALVFVVPKMGSPQSNMAIFEAGAAKALGKQVLAVMPDSLGREPPTDLADLAIFDGAKKPMKDVARTLLYAIEPATAN